MFVYVSLKPSLVRLSWLDVVRYYYIDELWGIYCKYLGKNYHTITGSRCIMIFYYIIYKVRHFKRLVRDRRNSSALAMKLCLSCTNPSICTSLTSPLINPYGYCHAVLTGWPSPEVSYCLTLAESYLVYQARAVWTWAICQLRGSVLIC